ncbi:hypothetical protein [Algoriphagus sp.]|uniref:hypothetical protein n=1 Tax=Algoriphagus sp. TaxID=1872435 RepID=UPI003F7226F9
MGFASQAGVVGETLCSIVYSSSFYTLLNLSKWKGIALERLHKMLAYGGSLYIKDVVIEKENSTRNIQAFIGRQELLGGDFLRDDAEVHFREEFSTYDWILDGLLERAGFKILSKELYDGVIAEYLCVKE